MTQAMRHVLRLQFLKPFRMKTMNLKPIFVKHTSLTGPTIENGPYGESPIVFTRYIRST